MYGTAEVKADSGRPMFMAGISDNTELSNIAFENSKTDGSGKDVLTFTFSSSNGGTFRKIFWEVDPSKVIEMNQKYPRNHTRDNQTIKAKKGEPISDDQAVQMAFDEFNRQIKHIMTKYMSDDEAIISNVNSYRDFAMAVISKMKGKYEGKKMRMKTVYTKNDYLDIPRFGNFIESMDVPKEKSSIVLNISYDKITRSTPSSEESVSAAVSMPDTTNDLPF